MPIQYFDNLGAIGIIKDTPDTELPGNAFTDGQNVRFTEGAVSKITGHEEVFGTPAGAPYYAFPVNKRSDYFWMYASLTDLFITDGTSHGTISETTGSANATADIGWNGGVLGDGIVVMNSGVDEPLEWTGIGLTDQFAPLSNWPAGMIARVIRPFKQVLVAADIDEGSGRDGTLLRWSHPAAPGSVPASWDYNDDAYDAGRVTIAQGGDFIIDMAPIRDLNMIYKSNSTWTMQFVGGRGQYAFRKVFDNLGLMSTRCVKEVFGRHIVLANGDAVIHDGQTVQQFLTRKWKRWLFNNIDGTNYARSFVTVNHGENEVWICFPQTGYTLPNIALIWNWWRNTVYVRELPVGTAHIAHGIVDTGASSAIEDWSGTAEDDTGIFDEQSYSAAERYLLMCDADKTKFYRADTSQQFNGSNFTSYVERSAVPLGRMDANGQVRKIDLMRMKFITAIIPIIEGTIGGIVKVYIGTRDYLGDTVSWNGPFNYTIGSSDWLKVRVSGRIIDLRILSDSNITWKMPTYGVEYEFDGER